MKLYPVASAITLLILSACAARQPVVVTTPMIPENSFKGIVEKSVPATPIFMRDIKLQLVAANETPIFAPINLNYVWFYEHQQTLGQHLSAWAQRFAYRFESNLPLSLDPIVKSDGTYVGNLYGAIEDISYFADQGRSNFVQVDETKKLYTHKLIITLSERQRYLRIEPRPMQINTMPNQATQAELPVSTVQNMGSH